MTGLLIATLVAFLAWAAVLAYRRDAQRQKARRRSLAALSVASRARSLAECPPEFMDRLRQTMGLDEEAA